MESLYIYCAGGLGREIFDLAYSVNLVNKKWQSIYFVDDNKDMLMPNNTEVITFDCIKNNSDKDNHVFLIASGEPKTRALLHKKIQDYGFKLTTLKSNLSSISPFSFLSEGTVVFPYCFIGANVQIGQNNILHTNSIVSHDSRLGNSCMVCPGVNIGGCVKIGDEVFIGIGATIKNSLIIGNHVVIGFGSALANDLDDYSVVMSNIAKKIDININKKVFK